MKLNLRLPLSLGILLAVSSAYAQELGAFEKDADIGKVSHPGSAKFDQASREVVITGGGENMWFTNDAFNFVWEAVSGDFTLQSAVEWLQAGGNAHRKACLIARQNLSAGSPYLDVAVHGDGLISLQYREKQDGPTHEIQAVYGPAARVAPGLVALSRQGDTFFLSLSDKASGVPAEPSGAFMRLHFSEPLLVGLGVCAHDDSKVETARFSQVVLRQNPAKEPAAKPILHCALEVVPIASKDRRVIYHTLDHIEAPNWSRDGRFFLFNANGHIYRLPVEGGKPELLDTGFANRCNNDHGLSPDGKFLAISDQTRGGKSLIYVLPLAGGEPRLITPAGPSYWHGWSPDGATLAYCAERQGEFDVYTVPVQGGEEKKLTSAKGLDDGPDFTADGKWIYFNSERSGSMQIWRMKPDGTAQEQVTSDEFNNWFPHPSPDGKWLVFLSYEKGVTGHPANQTVKLRLMPLNGGSIQELAKLFGGQGTINVPSWSPDSRQVAFVSYELIQP